MREPSLADHLREALVHGLQLVWVEVVDYDEQWPSYFERYRAGLVSVLGDRASFVEHIGSTSVPGLAAKPVIDIVVGLQDPEDEPAYIPDLEAAGYQVRVRETGHRCLRGEQEAMPVNLHCYRTGADEVGRYLLFRDRLRASPADRDLYAGVKRTLAGRQWPDMNFYAEAKSPTIEKILRRATNQS